MEQWLEQLAVLIENNFFLAPLMAFLGGILTSFTPCSLSSIPLIVGYVGGIGENNPKKAFYLSLVFVFGSAITFTSLGVFASLAGKLIGSGGSLWYIFLGVLMVLMALQIWGIWDIIPSRYLVSRNTKKGYLGALLAGILGGIFSSPCSTPVLVSLLAIVASKGSILWGIFLLLLYSLGHGILVVLVGTFLGLGQKITNSSTYGKLSLALKIIMGGLILVGGFYMFYLGF